MGKIRKLFKISKAPICLTLIVAGSMLFLAAFNVILSALLQEGLNSAIYGKSVQTTGIFAILLFFSCMVYLVLSYVFPVYREKLYQCISKNLKSRVLQGVLRKPLKEIESMAEGDFLTSVVEDCDNCSGYLIQSVLPAVQLIVNIIIGLIFVFLQEWRIGVFLVVLMPVFYFLNKSCTQKYEEAYEEYLVREGQQKTYFTEVHKNILLVLAYSLQSAMNKKSDLIYKYKFDAARKQAKSISNMITFTETGVLCIELIVLFLGIVFSQIGWIKYGTMIAVWNVAIGSVVYPISELPYVLTGLIGQMVSLDRIEKVICEKKENCTECVEKVELDNPRLKAMKVKYRVSENFSVCADEFECKIGQIVYVVGPSGSGKSTFAKLLLSLYKPDEGEIVIEDNTKLEKQLGMHVSYVPQEKLVCNLSVLDNLTMGDRNVREEKITDSLVLANIYNAIAKNALKYEAVLGKDIKLSVGQEQRVAIARAYLRDTEFIIFDEPFASLDANNVKVIGEMIKEMSKKHGCIVITHNTSMISENDIVYQRK